MLDERSLSNALMAAVAKADVCRRWCSVGSKVEEATYEVWHNGTGSSDTDHQRIHSSKRLAHAEEALAGVMADWITKLHKRERMDLNEES